MEILFSLCVSDLQPFLTLAAGHLPFAACSNISSGSVLAHMQAIC